MTTRREFLRGSSLTLLGAAAPLAARSAPPVRAEAMAPGTQSLVEAETVYGRIRGVRSGSVSSFKGIPYGASSGEGNRFMPPQAPVPWTGVRECLQHGPVCPQTLPGERSDDVAPGGMSEDCLNLNLWTPGLRDGMRRPVLVYFPGEGFSRGSANAAATDGAQLALAGDVVVIGVNHRVGRFGFLQLADQGDPAQFAQAGVAGLMDLTAALEWVRDHAERFGGDPRNVMIFGQSGGGAKVSSLLATRAAQGLFHRAAIQSGSLLRFEPRDLAAQQASELLRTLGISRTHLKDAQALPWQQLLSAPVRGAAAAVGTRPVLDGRYLTHDPFGATAPDESAGVPLIVSSTLEDESLRLTNVTLGESELKSSLDKRFAGRGRELLALYRRYYPDRSPFLIQAQAFTDAGLRRAALHQAELKAAQGRGAVYVYEWDWSGADQNERYGAAHGLDVAATFLTALEPGAQRLATQLSSAWLSFARTGKPAVAQQPSWPEYDVTTRSTMVFGTPTQVVNDPRGEIRQYWQHAPARDSDGV